VFVIMGGTIFTPPLAALDPGRRHTAYVIELAKSLGYEVREQLIAREMLYVADEMFLTARRRKVTPVRSVDRVPVGSGRRGPITRAIQEEFSALRGRKPDRFGWLTPVHAEAPVADGISRSFDGR